jgi:hypothetical protein
LTASREHERQRATAHPRTPVEQAIGNDDPIPGRKTSGKAEYIHKLKAVESMVKKKNARQSLKMRRRLLIGYAMNVRIILLKF